MCYVCTHSACSSSMQKVAVVRVESLEWVFTTCEVKKEPNSERISLNEQALCQNKNAV